VKSNGLMFRNFTSAHVSPDAELLHRVERFTLVTAAHRLLLNVLPFREPDSRQALSTFIDTAQSSRLPMAEVDAVLLRCLAILDRHTGGIWPTLVEQYIQDSSNISHTLNCFSQCIRNFLRYKGIGNPVVQSTIKAITEECGNSNLSPRLLADKLGVRLSVLGSCFKEYTGQTLSQYIRDVRLQTAALLLAHTAKSIKEVWSSVGYNHASNFTHDFRKRFGITPRQHRMRIIYPLVEQRSRAVPIKDATTCNSSTRSIHPKVLVVDDDVDVADIICTYLGRGGYAAVQAGSGRAAIHEYEHSGADIVLVDYHLADMTGFECVQTLRRFPSDGEVAAIVFTADLDVLEKNIEAYGLNVTLLSKLCDLDRIATMVDQLLSK
jgi:AraC-like DNA-binding protein